MAVEAAGAGSATPTPEEAVAAAEPEVAEAEPPAVWTPGMSWVPPAPPSGLGQGVLMSLLLPASTLPASASMFSSTSIIMLASGSGLPIGGGWAAATSGSARSYPGARLFSG